MHRHVQQSDPFVNYVIHHESKLKFIVFYSDLIAEKVKRFEDSQWGTKQESFVESSGKTNTTGRLGKPMSRNGIGSSNVSKRTSAINQENFHPITGMEIDPHLDFRALGKNTKCSIDHSKYHCILPYTSIKQPSLKINFVKLIND
jgi:hypothetical protein